MVHLAIVAGIFFYHYLELICIEISKTQMAAVTAIIGWHSHNQARNTAESLCKRYAIPSVCDRIRTVYSLICVTRYIALTSLDGIPTHFLQSMHTRCVFLRFKRYLEAGYPYIAHTCAYKARVIIRLNLGDYDWGRGKAIAVIDSIPDIGDSFADSC